MATHPPAPMTPGQLLDHVQDLIRARREQEALEYASRFIEPIYPDLSVDEAGQLEGLLETAATMVALRRWEREGFPPPRGERDA